MAIVSYRVCKVSPLRWRWEIERNGRPVGIGYSLSRPLARRAARARLAGARSTASRARERGR